MLWNSKACGYARHAAPAASGEMFSKVVEKAEQTVEISQL